MNKLRINILTPIPFWHPGTEEFINHIRNNGYEVVALDIWDYYYYDEKGNIHNLIPKYLSGFLKKVYRKLLRKIIIKKYIAKDDIIDIQWCGHYYAKYINFLHKHNCKIIATPFGSDVLRATTEERAIQRKIFDFASIIVLGKNWIDTFKDYFPGLEEKLRFNQFGSARFDQILEIWSPEYKRKLREKYKIEEGKICVTVGYSANPVQQHIRFLDMIISKKDVLKDKITLIFPLTYGISKTSDYYLELLTAIKNSGFDYRLFESRLSDEELCETRIVSDIMVNMQTTDTQASSIKEAFAARNVVIVGDWLPYEFYEEMGVRILRSDIDNFLSTFETTVRNLESIKINTLEDYKKVASFASWHKIIPEFINNYLEVKNGRD